MKFGAKWLHKFLLREWRKINAHKRRSEAAKKAWRTRKQKADHQATLDRIENCYKTQDPRLTYSGVSNAKEETMKTVSKSAIVLLLALVAMPAFAAFSSATAVPGEGGIFLGCLFYGNGRAAVGVPIKFYASAPGLQSGYHPHDTGFNRPNVVFNSPTTQYTNANGCAEVDILLPYYAGVYTIYAYGDGLSSHTQITVSIAGLNNPLPTVNHFGLGPLSKHFDPNHGGWQWYGKFSTNTKLLAVSDRWFAVTANFYGPMYLYRYGLPNGGDLDNGPFPLWAATLADAHISGIEFDIDNPLVVNGNIPQNDMLVAITQACGFNGRIAPAYGYKTIEYAYVWHVYCP